MTADLGALATRGVQTVCVTCEAWLGGVDMGALDVVAGQVTADARRAATRDATVTFTPAPGQSYDDLYALLSIPGLQLALARGFAVASGSSAPTSTVTAPLGVFIVDQLTYKRAGAASSYELTAVCSDLSAHVTRARWTQPYQIAAGTALADAINAAVRSRWPSAASNVTAANTTGTLGAQAVFDAGADSDPWQDICSLATSFGYLLSFDETGTLSAQVITPLASQGTVFTFATGSAAIMTSQSQVVAADQMYNGVIVTGEGSDVGDAPPRGEAWDTNPASPTYCLGPFGYVPTFYSSPLITTTAQAAAVAAAQLAAMLGKVEQLSWEQIAHPGLQPLDVVAVEFPDGTTQTFILDALTVPLTLSDVMTATARSTLG
jgi:hypothetical protein